MSPSTISSERLEKILEVNSKAIEINTIVSMQYEKMLELLNLMKLGDKIDKESLEEFIDELEKQHNKIIETNKEIKTTSENIIAVVSSIKEIVERTDRTLFKLSVILVSSSAIVTTLVNVVAKLFLNV